MPLISTDAATLLWLALVSVMLWIQWRRGTTSVGLPLAYLVNTTIIHLPVPLTLLLSNLLLDKSEHTNIGFVVSTWAMFFFCISSLLTRYVVAATSVWTRFQWASPSSSYADTDSHGKTTSVYVALGLMFFFLQTTPIAQLPSAAAILSVGQLLVLAALCVWCWQAMARGQMVRALRRACLGLLYPVFTMAAQGFLGFGTTALVTLFVFISVFLRPRWVVGVAFLCVLPIGLSVFVTYMRDRGEIRARVWGGDDFAARFSQIADTFVDFEIFSTSNPDHLNRIASRLNQNELVGAAVQHIQATGVYARGATFFDAAIAIIPRALWPDKPITAGSGNLVSQYTGIQFAYGTSVGVGQILEMYMNFGMAAVAIGFSILGALLTLLDIGAAQRLAAGETSRFIMLFVVGLMFTNNVGGQLVEITAGIGAALVITLALNLIVGAAESRARRQHQQPLMLQVETRRAEPAV